MLHILTSAPLLDSFASELSGVAEITKLEPDGTFDAAPSTIFDGVFVGPEAFSFGRERFLQLNRSIAELILAKRVLWVHLCASGIDGAIFHAPMKAAHTAGAKLTHSPGVYATPIAHYCLAHMLSITRELREHAADQSAGVYNSRIQKDVRSMTVGIVGAGGIGEEVARLAKACGMRTLGFRRSFPSTPSGNFDEVLVGPDGLPSLLAASHFVIVAVPLTPATRGMIGAPEFQSMRTDGWLINVSRGAVVDEEALATALVAEGVAPAGAVLDVFAREPLPPDSPLWKMPNCIMTPHDSWRTDHAYNDNYRYFVDNVRRLAAGEPLQGVVPQELLQPALQ